MRRGLPPHGRERYNGAHTTHPPWERGEHSAHHTSTMGKRRALCASYPSLPVPGCERDLNLSPSPPVPGCERGLNLSSLLLFPGVKEA